MDYLTTYQAAEYLGVSAARVWVFINEGRLSAERVGRSWLIHKSELERFAKIPRPQGRKKGFSPKKSAK